MTQPPYIALVHPPAGPERMYQLDGYCSQPQKGPFRWHQLDFIAFASKLANSADISIHDLGTEHKIRQRITTPPDIIIGLAGAYGWNTHERFWRDLIQAGHMVYLSGDICRHDPNFVFSRLPGLAGIIPELACCPDIEELFSGQSPRIWTEKSPHIVPEVKKGFKTGIQNYNLWNHKMYKLPFAPGKRFASVFSQVGCPFSCSYCILSSYPFANRDIEEFEEEIQSLKKQGVEHIYLRDATFNSCPNHVDNVCRVMKKSGLPWNTFARLGNLESISEKLSQSGCRLVQIGFDSPSKTVLELYEKKINSDPVSEVSALHKAGVKTVGHFVMGLDQNHTDDAKNILSFSKQLKLDWITVTPLMVRPGTKMWDSSLADSLEKDYPELEKTIDGIMKKFYFSASGMKTLLPVVFKDPSVLTFAVKKALSL